MAGNEITTPGKGLLALRSTLGIGGWVAPGPTLQVFGLPLAGNPSGEYMTRLFAVRDLALAVGVVATKGSARTTMLRIGVACDVLDAAAGVLAGRDGLPKVRAVMVTGTALAAAGMGIAELVSGS